MSVIGDLPKGREFVSQCYLPYEGHIHFLGEPSVACGKNSVCEGESYSSKGNQCLVCFRIITLAGILGGCLVYPRSHLKKFMRPKH